MPRAFDRTLSKDRGFWRLTGSRDADREALRKSLDEQVSAWEAAGNKVAQVPMGQSGYASSGSIPTSKYREKGLKKLNTPKKEENEDE